MYLLISSIILYSRYFITVKSATDISANQQSYIQIINSDIKIPIRHCTKVPNEDRWLLFEKCSGDVPHVTYYKSSDCSSDSSWYERYSDDITEHNCARKRGDIITKDEDTEEYIPTLEDGYFMLKFGAAVDHGVYKYDECYQGFGFAIGSGLESAMFGCENGQFLICSCFSQWRM